MPPSPRVGDDAGVRDATDDGDAATEDLGDADPNERVGDGDGDGDGDVAGEEDGDEEAKTC